MGRTAGSSEGGSVVIRGVIKAGAVVAAVVVITTAAWNALAWIEDGVLKEAAMVAQMGGIAKRLSAVEALTVSMGQNLELLTEIHQRLEANRLNTLSNNRRLCLQGRLARTSSECVEVQLEDGW